MTLRRVVQTERIQIPFLLASLIVGGGQLLAQSPANATVVDLKTPDGIVLKATYFAAAKPVAVAWCSSSTPRA